MPESAYGIQEIVTDALSIRPASMDIWSGGRTESLEYATRAVDVSAWAQEQGRESDLLDFADWSYR